MTDYLNALFYDLEERKKVDMILNSIINQRNEYRVIILYGDELTGKSMFSHFLQRLSSFTTLFELSNESYASIERKVHETSKKYLIETHELPRNIANYDNLQQIQIHFTTKFQIDDTFDTHFAQNLENYVNETIAKFKE